MPTPGHCPIAVLPCPPRPCPSPDQICRNALAGCRPKPLRRTQCSCRGLDAASLTFCLTSSAIFSAASCWIAASTSACITQQPQPVSAAVPRAGCRLPLLRARRRWIHLPSPPCHPLRWPSASAQCRPPLSQPPEPPAPPSPGQVTSCLVLLPCRPGAAGGSRRQKRAKRGLPETPPAGALAR